MRNGHSRSHSTAVVDGPRCLHARPGEVFKRYPVARSLSIMSRSRCFIRDIVADLQPKKHIKKCSTLTPPIAPRTNPDWNVVASRPTLHTHIFRTYFHMALGTIVLKCYDVSNVSLAKSTNFSSSECAMMRNSAHPRTWLDRSEMSLRNHKK